VMTAWQQLDGHLNVVGRIVAIASAFGPNGPFAQVTQYALADNHRVDDRAIACSTRKLVADSAVFQRPDGPHRASAFFRVGGLMLHSITEMQARYNDFAAREFDRINSGPRGGQIGPDGRIYEDVIPKNPYRREKVST